MTAPILVTGASGFLGLHLVEVLRKQGHQVRSLGRSHSEALVPLEVEQIQGSVLNPEDCAKAMEGVSAVYHLAGRVSRDKKDAGQIHKVHVTGTRNILEAAKAADVRQILVSSTSGTVGVSEDEDFLGTEDSPYPWEIIAHWAYYESKVYTEKEIARYVAEGLPVKMVRPSLLLGPRDLRGSSTGDVVKFLSGDVKAALPGSVSLVDVRDVADVLPRVMERGEPGVGYLLTAANLSVRDFLLLLEQASGVQAPNFEIPRQAINAAGGLLKRVSKMRLMGGLDEQTFEMGCHYWAVDSTRAQVELGFTPRPVEATIQDTVDDLLRGERL